MFSYVNTKKGFLNDFYGGHISSWLKEELENIYTEYPVADSETASWHNTLPYMAILLEDQRIPDDAEIIMEYILEQADEKGAYRRVDVVLAGTGRNVGRMNIILMEFKQWSNFFCNSEGKFFYRFGGKIYDWNVDNPSQQVSKYAQHIQEYNSEVRRGQIDIHKVVYLHNLNRELENSYDDYSFRMLTDPALADRVFFEGQVNELRDYLAERIGGQNERSVLSQFLKGEPGLSHGFMRQTDSLFREEDIPLRIDQQHCYDRIIKKMDACVERGNDTGIKIVVTGGPGSGKSIIALKIFKKYREAGYNVKYLVPGSALHDTLKHILPDEYKDHVVYQNIFKEQNHLADILIIDEMHRCRKPFIEEISQKDNALKVILGFYDKKQEQGSDAAGLNELDCAQEDVYSLTSLLRCGGDKGYISWIEKVLYGEDDLFSRGNIFFDYDVIDTVDELIRYVQDPDRIVLVGPFEKRTEIILENEEGNIKMETFSNLYISRKDRRQELKNIFSLYHHRNNSIYFGNLNSIYGVEAENIIVVIGNELCVRDGRLELSEEIYDDESARKKYLGMTCNKDKKNRADGGRDLNQEEKARMDRYVKNIYRILLTRGMKSCRVYCKDEGVRNLFRR